MRQVSADGKRRRSMAARSSTTSSCESLSRYCRKRMPASRSSRAKLSIESPACSRRPASRMGYRRGSLHVGENLLAALLLALEEALHELGIKVSLAELSVLQDAAVEGDGGVDPLDDEHLKGPRHPSHGFWPVFAVDDQLGYQ